MYKVCSVIGFPLGATTTGRLWKPKCPAHGAARSIWSSALKRSDELVAGYGKLFKTAKNALLKVIIETALLTDEEKVIASLLSKEAGADFVKTSTGFSSGGATVHDVALMRRAVGPAIGVKASGGIHSHEDAEQMIAAGATRIGASAGIKIIRADGSAPTESKPGSKTY